jgi:membrane protein implicated in regulation of membrane protease activity
MVALVSSVDWPLATVLAIVFVVTSVLRWRYFRRRATRADRASRAARERAEREPPAS